MSLIDEMIADIYLNAEDKTITILHSEPFEDELLECIFYIEDKDLALQFEEYELPFGVDLEDEFEDYLMNSDEITFLLMNINTKEAISGQVVQLRLQDTIDNESHTEQ